LVLVVRLGCEVGHTGLVDGEDPFLGEVG